MKNEVPHALRERHYSVAPLENHVRKCIKTCQHIGVWKRYYMRIGMLLSQTPLGIDHISLILCQVNQHLHNALLTKLLGQSIKD